jgi:hypothetical protein
MKAQQLLPVLAAAIGFSLAWAIKPGGSAESKTASADSADVTKAPRNDYSRTRPKSIIERKPKEVDVADFPLAEQADKGPKKRTEAKMLRLSEALDLTIDQQAEIIGALEETKAAATDQVPIIQDLATRGKTLEETLAKILSPEQLAKFEELRVRERENRIEARAQRSLSQVIEEIDLSPGQREEVLARLRQYAKEQMQAIPSSATLLLNTSMLPTASNDLTVDGVLVLTRISEEPVAPTNPMEAHQELEERLRCFDGVLTPGQMAQVYAAIAEKQNILNKLYQPPVRDDNTLLQNPTPEEGK